VLNNLRLRTKLMLLPGLASLGLLLALATAWGFGRQNLNLINRIQTGYLPAAQVSRSMVESLEKIQRSLQDAVTAQDLDMLAAADQEHARFNALLEQARTNPVMDAKRISEISTAMDDYYKLAHTTSRSMIGQEAPESVARALPAMTSKFNAMRTRVEQGMAADAKDMDNAFEGAQAAQTQSIIWMLAVLGVTLIGLATLGLVIVRGVTRSLVSLTTAAQRIATENDLRTDVEITSNDEFGELARAFQSMVVKLREISKGMKSTVAQLGTAMGEFTAVTKEQSELLQRQAASVAETSATTQEIKQTSAVAANKGESVLQVASRAEELAAGGQRAVEGSMTGLQSIRVQVDDMVSGINNLAERVQAASEIVERVREIATQSNMLALNAAIEATKAGEYGKGFTLVAREIRLQADQSLQSAARIREILADLQSALRATVASSAEGARRMEEGEKQITSAGESFRGVISVVEQSSQAAQQIVAAVSQQNGGIAQISAAVMDLNVSAESAVKGVQRIEQSTARLSAVSVEVEKMIDTFRT